ncbi:hypothetical protein CORC01_11860 [Colletotrichum orchidophilum]|uniref:Uncharacterized protein n=1 Tax=Colletotrichum orchidophilum TaxID=1209926 RepID=A0A1G4AUN4_9PEZI|nr:uncharacterized protein CORC01_11860 [Colletotrichum orchidophilum]OHE92854.1 hypothetical protein CORC01_11860 [Colletotrichum orchidophilum]
MLMISSFDGPQVVYPRQTTPFRAGYSRGSLQSSAQLPGSWLLGHSLPGKPQARRRKSVPTHGSPGVVCSLPSPAGSSLQDAQ